VATCRPQAMHAVTRPFFFHVLQGRLECSDHPELSLEPGEASDPEDLAATADYGVGAVAVVAVVLSNARRAHVGRVGP